MLILSFCMTTTSQMALAQSRSVSLPATPPPEFAAMYGEASAAMSDEAVTSLYSDSVSRAFPR